MFLIKKEIIKEVNEMEDKLRESLKFVPGIGPEISNEEVTLARQVIAQYHTRGDENPERIIETIREEIHKYRHKKRLTEIEVAKVRAAEKVVAESLEQRGLV